MLTRVKNMTIGLLIVAAAIVITIVWTVVARSRGYKVGTDAIVRCSAGHLYTTIWIPGGSLKSVRLGTSRFQWCPVGRHWAAVTLVQESELTEDEIRQAHEHHDVRIP
jgi:hypothetical protein